MLTSYCGKKKEQAICLPGRLCLYHSCCHWCVAFASRFDRCEGHMLTPQPIRIGTTMHTMDSTDAFPFLSSIPHYISFCLIGCMILNMITTCPSQAGEGNLYILIGDRLTLAFRIGCGVMGRWMAQHCIEVGKHKLFVCRWVAHVGVTQSYTQKM